MRRAMWVVSCLLLAPLAGVPVTADQGRRSGAAPSKIVTDVQCPADLGKGVKTRRTFCDVMISADPADGITMRIPPHTGPTVLRFDLHNRFNVSGTTLPFVRAAALVAALNGNNGSVIERASVVGELRKELDLFDRIVGSGPGGTKTVAPGRAEPVRISLPAATTSVSVVGVRLELTTKDGRVDFATPGRPVALASNFRIEYTPATVGKQ
jgi:hypothetical protein